MLRNFFILLTFVLNLSTTSAREYMTTLKGQNFLTKKMSEYSLKTEGKLGSVVVFLSSVCPCSNSHYPHILDLSERFPEFNFYGVHSNITETIPQMEIFYEDKTPSFPILIDKGAKIATNFDAIKTPHVYVFSPQGKLFFHGGVTNSTIFKASDKHYLEETLTNLKNGKKLARNFARALGCYLERE